MRTEDADVEPAASDRELALRCVVGDGDAQRELVRRVIPLVWSLCRRAGIPAADAEDVSQDALTSAFVALPRYRGDSRLTTWFCTLAFRRIADYLRSPARRDVPAGDRADTLVNTPAIAVSPEAHAASVERNERVRNALDRLGEPARSVLVAYYLGEVPVAEIARAMQMPPGTVKTHLHRGRLALREELKDLW